MTYKRVFLGELYDISSGLSKGKAFFGHGYPFLSFKTVFENHFLPDGLSDLADTSENERSAYSIRRGDVFLTRTSENTEELGMSCVALKDYPDATFNGFTKRLRPKPGVLINPIFAGFWFRSPRFRELVKSMSVMTTRASLNKEMIQRLSIPLPSIQVQNAIADILYCLEAQIANNLKINHHLEQMAQAIFKSWFMEFKPIKPFTSIVQVLGGGTPQTSTAHYWGGTIPFFTPKDAIATYVLRTEKSLTESGLNNCNSRLYPVNTVFVTARGTVGKLAMAGVPMAMNQSCYALIGNAGYGQHFVYHLALETVESLKHKASGAVFDAIVTRDFESEIVPAPSVESVWVFEEKVAPIYKAILNNLKESARLADLRDALLPRLMSGELSVVDVDAK